MVSNTCSSDNANTFMMLTLHVLTELLDIRKYGIVW